MKAGSLILFFVFSFFSEAFSQRGGGTKKGLFSDDDIQSLASQQFGSFLSTDKMIDTADAALVQKVAQRVFDAVKNYYGKKKANELKGYTWEVRLVDKKDVNAFCLPGARVIVGTGMFDWAQNEGSLAVVLAHEMAHLVAGHCEERLKSALQNMMNGKPLSELRQSKPADARDIFLAAYGAGSNVGLLTSFSLEDELEADRLGMIFTGLAGYNPREALVFWERMDRLSRGPRQPVLMSAHRGDEARIRNMQEIVDDMIKNYYRAPKTEGMAGIFSKN